MRSLVFPLSFLLCFGTFAFAQETARMTGGVGFGFTTSVGSTSANLDNTGWNAAGGIGVNATPYFGVMADVGFNYLAANKAALTSLGADNGNVGLLTAMLDPVVHVMPHHRVDVYFTGGGGVIHQGEVINAPYLTTSPVSNPFFGVYSANQALAAYTHNVTKPGYDVGAGVAFGSVWHAKMFAEARYYHMFSTGSHTDFIPVTFGFRW
jgi:hypothetical protein